MHINCVHYACSNRLGHPCTRSCHFKKRTLLYGEPYCDYWILLHLSELLKRHRTFKVAMIFQLIILTTTSLFSQVKCRTYIPEKYSVEHNPNNRQTHHATEQQQQTVYVDKRQYPNGWNENIMRGDRSPIIFTDKAPVTINYNGGHSSPGQSPYGFRNSCPIVLTSQGKITVNYDGPQDNDDVPPSNRDICLLTNTMVELPSGIVMPYLKFKTISPYLPENQKSDVRIILDNKNMTYKQFQETLRYHGCDDLEDSPQPSSEVDLTNYVTLADGTQVEKDDYRNIVSGITSGSETLMVPNVVSGKYSLYRSLIADELPEMIPSAFVITQAGDVVPFSLYHAVDTEHFQRPSTAMVPRIRQIKWRDGKLVDVQTVRHVIDALKTPTMISFVFPNRKRMPFVQCDVKESTELYDYDPKTVVVDVGQCKNVLLSHFNDILFAVRIPDDSATGDGKYRRFNPPVFAWNPAKCMNTAATNAQPDGKVCNKSNNVDNGNYSGYSIHVTNKDKRRTDDKPADKQLTVFGPVSAMEKTTCLDSNDTIRIILTSSSGTHEIKITNVLNNKKPLIYDITDKPVNIRDLKNIISQNECDYSPLLINKTNSTNVTNIMNPQNNNCTNILITNTENDCKPIIKNNETNDTTDIKNTPDSKDPSYLNESTQHQTVTMCNKNATTNNNKNQTTETITTTVVTQNNTELTNTTNTSGKINNTAIENENNDGTKTPDRTEKCSKDQQNDCSPAVTGSNEIPITKNTDKNQTQITNTTQTNVENSVCSNGTHTDKKSEKNNTITTETKNNTTTSIPNNCQNSSNPISESITTSVIQNNNNQTETNNTTTINNAPNVNANTTDSNTTNAYKKPKPDEAVAIETRNNTTTDPKNNQNSSNPGHNF
ncbi:hypothetical protein AGLY_007605 [Aphis glycines]|uniref:Uncharacterized protein n=1 Tax=Aphis glycines TaxID=307491 RepID=A0A6G0TNC8_APHGL|nr:hypothetical protein AGLY_007605 [Aphis glycines]